LARERAYPRLEGPAHGTAGEQQGALTGLRPGEGRWALPTAPQDRRMVLTVKR